MNWLADHITSLSHHDPLPPSPLPPPTFAMDNYTLYSPTHGFVESYLSQFIFSLLSQHASLSLDTYHAPIIPSPLFDHTPPLPIHTWKPFLLFLQSCNSTFALANLMPHSHSLAAFPMDLNPGAGLVALYYIGILPAFPTVKSPLAETLTYKTLLTCLANEWHTIYIRLAVRTWSECRKHFWEWNQPLEPHEEWFHYLPTLSLSFLLLIHPLTSLLTDSSPLLIVLYALYVLVHLLMSWQGSLFTWVIM